MKKIINPKSNSAGSELSRQFTITENGILLFKPTTIEIIQPEEVEPIVMDEIVKNVSGIDDSRISKTKNGLFVVTAFKAT